MTSKQPVQLESLTDGTPITYGVVKPGDAPKDNGVLFIRGGDIKAGNINRSSLRTISKEVSEQYKRTLLKGGELLVSLVGNPGEVAIVPAELAGANLARQVGLIRLDEKRVNKTYVQYYLRSPQGKGQLAANSLGSVQSVINLKELKKLEIPLPEKGIQDRIANILLTLDEKLQCNHQINQTLEQMAQAIFKSWFVDFEPVKAKIAALEAGGSEEDALLAAMQAISGKGETELTSLQAEQPAQYAELRATAELFPSAMQDSELGEIPEGWGVDHLSELIQFNPRRSLKKGTLAPYLDMKNVPTSGHLADDVVLRQMNSGTKFVNGDTLLARITPCLENGKTAYVDFLDSDQVGWGSTEYIVMRSQEPYPESISYFIARDESFRQHAIQSMTGTSGRQRANAKALAELPWIIYPLALAEAFNRVAFPYIKLARSHGDESKSLSGIRDTLLPKLLSGELSVIDAENQMTEEERMPQEEIN